VETLFASLLPAARARRFAGTVAALVALAAPCAVIVTLPMSGAGAATYAGSVAHTLLNRPIVGITNTPTGRGYWLVASDGGIFAFGDAQFYGSAGGMHLNRPIVSMATTPTGGGYWLVASDGGIFAFGDAHFYGSTGAMRLSQPIVGIANTPAGHGYWLVASDGGIFAFGDARFYGSTGAIRLHRLVVGMATSRDGRGYWLVASDGGIFAFGDARFYGSTGGMRLAQPIVSLASAPDGWGYWLLARDGGIFAFGSARFLGSAVGATAGQRAVDIASSTQGGYAIATQWGGVDVANSTGMHMDPNLRMRVREAAIAADMVRRINDERFARGERLLAYDPLLAVFAGNWAFYLGSHNAFFHQDLMTILRFANGALVEAGENLYAGNGTAADAGSAHLGLMESPPHRENILLPEHQLIGVGAACFNGTVWVVEDFGIRPGTSLAPHPIPALQPFVDNDGAGPSC
jgi:uncharacterized protein YkwD